MTTEEKAKRYDEALEKAKESLKDGGISQNSIDYIQSIFPELKESEDEKIRKALLEYFGEECDTATINGIYCYKIYAWLEKQAEKNKWKPSKDEMDALYGLAYITNEMDDRKDVAITKLYQDLKREFFNGASYENMFPSSPVDSDINVEKQGEQKEHQVYKTKDGEIITYSETDGYKVIEPKFKVGDWIIEPREGEPNGLWHIERIEDNNYWDGCTGVPIEYADKYYHLKIEKPAWSEEDEHRLEDAIYFLDTAKKHYASIDELDACIDWLKSIKQRMIGDEL